ncbi:hypothetical protein N8T08_010951 [Aspergillus melleus]|uniref:Uncharacterized protein n=1 Tax=Aspergillus melleus TaxID=138277 RepID=A0ACC3AQZ5_9EURO|nr:hypothetical protein N8T08_010951 [Aspergillus melleus]
MDSQQVVEHHSEHELEQGKRLKAEMDFEWQAPNFKTIPPLKPAKLYDPTEVKVWDSSPVISALPSVSAQNQPGSDANCPSYQTLPDCFDDTPMTEDEISQMFALMNDNPNEGLFVQQPNLELPEVLLPTSFSETGEASTDIVPDVTEESEWPQDDHSDQIEAAEAESSAKFEAAQEWFNSLENPTMVDLVTYQRAIMDENARKKQLVRRKAVESQMMRDREDLSDVVEDEQVFPSQGQDNAVLDENRESTSNAASNQPQAIKKRCKKNSITAKEKQRSIQLGLDIVLRKVQPKKRGRNEQDSAFDVPESSKRSKKPRKSSQKQMDKKIMSLFQSNLIQDAQANALLPAIPRFNKTDKQKALTELIASIPNADQKETNSDKKEILEASKKFNPSAKSDGNNGWKIRGIKSSLYHYQLLGTGFMRARELSDHAPFGGLLCDTMGFGKTIQAIANVVDGRPADEDDPLKTTLIVVPAHLVEHWREQFVKHCEPEKMVDALVYRPNSRLDTFNAIKGLQKFEVIITTYEEIRRSYPKSSAAPKVTDPKALKDWWHNVFEQTAGPLHRIKFLRIILDEGHFIKNHVSQTSIAVRALTGQFKWILSGTPVQNSIQEFYPLFDFLGVPGNENFETFEEYYYQDDESQKRLVNILRTVMFRRTHASRLFTLPVVKFPDIEERIVTTEFYPAEREIYDAIVDVFFKNINGLSAINNPKLAQYRCVLTMMLKLRMFCSHALTTQSMLKDLLSGPLSRELTNIERKCRDPEDPSVKISKTIRAMAKGTTLKEQQTQAEDPEDSTSTIQGDKAKLIAQFHEKMCKLHEEEQWDERLDRTNCPSCKMVPVVPVITSCMHLYCEECYYSLSTNDPSPSNSNPKCAECNLIIDEAALGVEVEHVDVSTPPSGKAAQRNKQKPGRKWAKGRSGGGMFRMSTPRSETAPVPEKEEETDWIPVCAANFPSAKLTKIRETVAHWIAENPDVKVVIFTQFLDFVRILTIMCQVEGWPSACLTGKMRLHAREENLKEFAHDGGIRVLIASLKAGGIGLDMSMANKCILVDLWWNEAIQDQAFCRLYRIGQDKNVEFVKIIVSNTIDEHLLDLQTKKTEEISSTMGNDVLAARETVKTLLQLFGDVAENEDGGLRVVRRKDKKGKQAVH